MTPKEAFKGYKQVATWLSQGEFDNYSPYIKLGNELLELSPIIEQSLTELEELKRDVKRFMEIANDCVVIDDCIREYIDLRRKLSKVGNEK